MMTKTKAIVLNSIKYGENRLFVNVFSREYGMITLSCSTGRKKGKGSRANCFQPLNIVETEFEMKPKADIYSLHEVRIDYPAMSIAVNPYKISISLFIAEFLRYALRNETRNDMLYDYITQSIEWLDSAETGFANFHLVFMTKLLRFIGFYPDINSFFPGAWFDLSKGTFSTRPAYNTSVLSPADASIVPTLDRLSYASMHLLRLSREQRNECTDKILRYYRYHLPSFPELKSFSVMKELFA